MKRSNDKIEWTPEMIADLSLMGMKEHGIKYGISYGSSGKKRAALKLPRKPIEWTGHYKKFIWPENEVELFKWNTNTQLQVMLGFPYGAISERRNIIGIEMDSSVATTECVLHEKVVEARMLAQGKKRKSMDKKMQVYALHEQNLAVKEIARLLNISVSRVSAILCNEVLGSEIKRSLQQDINQEQSSGNNLALSIDSLDVQIRLKNTLKMAGINTLGDLIQNTKGDLMRLPNFSKHSFADIVIALEKYGLKIRMSIRAEKQSIKMNSIWQESRMAENS